MFELRCRLVLGLVLGLLLVLWLGVGVASASVSLLLITIGWMFERAPLTDIVWFSWSGVGFQNMGVYDEG